MKNRFLFFLIFQLLFVLNGFSQDSIVFLNGNRLYVKVTEIQSSIVKYALNGPSGIELKESDRGLIRYIRFSNGIKEDLNNDAAGADLDFSAGSLPTEIADVKPLKEKKTVLGKNAIAVNLFEFIFTNFAVSYERWSKDGNYSIRIPISFGLGGKPLMNNYSTNSYTIFPLQNKNYSAGLELNAYPFGAGRFNFYVGISALTTNFNYYEAYYTPYYGTSFNKHTGVMYAAMLHLGGNLGLSANIFIGAKAAFGFKYEETIYKDYTRPRIQFDLNIGYRF